MGSNQKLKELENYLDGDITDRKYDLDNSIRESELTDSPLL
jgi:hypothetical protein